MYGTAQHQLDSSGQTTRLVWHFYPHPLAHTHAMSYPLRVISTTDKNTSLSSAILHASHYTHMHTLLSPSQIFHVRTFPLCILAAVSIVFTG